VTLELDIFESPIGPVHLATDGRALVALDFGDPEQRFLPLLRARFGPEQLRRVRDPQGVTRALRAYFAGDLTALEQVPVDGGGTPFQRKVWAALRRIPVGQTTSYGALAAGLGMGPRGSRAVGLANGRNPICIAVPCHRVIGADGSLTGFASGVERKRWLLDHEAALGRAGQLGLPSVAAPRP
jgi:methylated-DNA-[protein]-cysteine S-methyltransferase